ncbi:MAG: 16S rRNA (cytosine(1402)-N(4))-methyltransferase RsmH [Mycoplasmataceae bacterium]|nr:16S rRNA (cytosine(1402)-N(4))-methyltransferase RsmH [Mycoplasmataceae bacterium]
MDKHYPVMLNEVVKALNIKPDGIYVDLTLGRGGHSSNILSKLDTGLLIAFDKDNQAIKESGPRLEQVGTNFKLVHSDYKNIKSELEKLGIVHVDGILADIGVSSPQLDESERGFSYSKDARLDMRMNQNQGLDAHVIVNEWSEIDIANILRDYADVMLYKRVAKGIVSERPIDTTLQLVDVIRKSLPAAVVRKKNPAKAVFQAIRIAVNQELEALKQLVTDGPELLSKDGSLAIITFHSIEDRIVKREFKKYFPRDTGKLPIIIEKEWDIKTYKPSKKELEENNRSRSAKLRVLTNRKD